MSPSWWQGLLLGLVQGITEFLPVSSSGHLVLAEQFLGYRPPGVFFEVLVHLATLLSVLIVYRQRIAEVLRGLVAGHGAAWSYAGLLLIATLPAGLLGVALRDYFERTFHSPIDLGWQFLLTALALWSTRWAMGRAKQATITVGRSLLIGAAQAVAIIPAISRSGATIAAALWAGLSPAVAAEFSFLMSIVVIAGSGVLEARHLPAGLVHVGPGLVWAFCAALLSGIAAIRLLVALLRSSRFHFFAPYCALLGLFCLLWFGIVAK